MSKLVIVPAISDLCIAHLVLTADGTPHEVYRVDGDELNYARLVADVWKHGEGFVIVEHDIAPWWGAIDSLVQCSNDWCMYHYAKDGGGETSGLGCVKFSDHLVKTNPNLFYAWINTKWGSLDGAVGSAIAKVMREYNPAGEILHYHNPPVAHARVPWLSL